MEQPTRMQMQWFYSNAQDVRQGGCLLVATDIASRGFDLPQTTHIYNFDLPKTAVDYLHRAGRTGRLPFSKEVCSVTNLITNDERFVLRKFENELMFQCEEVCLDSLALWNSTDACLKCFFFLLSHHLELSVQFSEHAQMSYYLFFSFWPQTWDIF